MYLMVMLNLSDQQRLGMVFVYQQPNRQTRRTSTRPVLENLKQYNTIHSSTLRFLIKYLFKIKTTLKYFFHYSRVAYLKNKQF